MRAALVLRAGPVSLRLSFRSLVVSVLLAAAVVALTLWAFTLGSYQVSMSEVVAALTGQTGGSVRRVVVEWRGPRVIGAVVFGAALGVSGAIFQSLTRNPLGSPDVIGFNTGSFAGVVAVMLIGGTGYLATAAGAVVGGLATAMAVYLLAFRRGVQGFRLIVVGIALNALLGSLTTWFSVKVDLDVALRAAVWGAGTLTTVTWTSVAISAGVFAVVAVFLPLAQRRMRHLDLGDDTAAALGLSVEPTKLALIVLGVVATALVTAACGPIAFLALVAPQIARRLLGKGASVDLAASALVGALLLLVADVVAQHAFTGLILPVGAVTVCVGGAYLVWLLAVESRRG
ncbi:iron chelate uptake ABC transporter family permease subunit [Phytomonospora sp. NPDC050363]|uniref:FecCD family ABC transporter permease n=1 Tax=Phytomonospora sp. NPDC050363 TaxID=3155642 RepID=UPI0033C7A6F6